MILGMAYPRFLKLKTTLPIMGLSSTSLRLMGLLSFV